MPKGMTFCELVNANKRVLEAKEVRVHEAWEEYRAFNTRTDENKDGKWKSPKTIIEKNHFFKSVIAEIGNRRVKDIEAEDLPAFWQKKKWSDQTRLNHFSISPAPGLPDIQWISKPKKPLRSSHSGGVQGRRNCTQKKGNGLD